MEEEKSEFDIFIEKNLNGDRCLYQSDEVEELIRAAWIGGMKEVKAIVLREQLKIQALQEQEEAKLQKYIKELGENNDGNS
jgi:hypothetical protein